MTFIDSANIYSKIYFFLFRHPIHVICISFSFVKQLILGLFSYKRAALHLHIMLCCKKPQGIALNNDCYNVYVF